MRNQSEPPSLAAIKTPISQEGFDQLFREARGRGRRVGYSCVCRIAV